LCCIVYSNMDTCLYCFGYNILVCCGFRGWMIFAWCFGFVLPNCLMSFYLVLDFLLFCVCSSNKVHISRHKLSDIGCLLFELAFCQLECVFYKRCILLVSHCYMAAVVFVPHS
jgi:hypothetical protein